MATDIRILARDILSRGFGLLERIAYERRRFDGTLQAVTRELYDPGNAAAVLLYDPSRRSVLLVRQFRLPAYLASGREDLVEICAGKLDGDDPLACIIRETREETGYVLESPRHVFDAFMSPGVYAEKLSFFVARYAAEDRRGAGGGLAKEGEDILVIERTLDEAIAMIEDGTIIDAKTIMMLHYAKSAKLMDAA